MEKVETAFIALVVFLAFAAFAGAVNYTVADNSSQTLLNGDCAFVSSANATVCWGIDTSESGNVLLGYSEEFVTVDNKTIKAPLRKDQTVQFAYAAWGVTPILNYSDPAQGLLVLAPAAVNCTNSTVTNTVYVNQTVGVCPTTNATIQLGYNETYNDSLRNQSYRAPLACVNTTINNTINISQTVFPNFEIDRTLKRGEVWGNGTLGIRLQCEQQDKQVDRAIKQGDVFAETDVCYSKLNIVCDGINLTPTPSPAPAPAPITGLSPANLPPQEPSFLDNVQKYWLYILAGVAIVVVVMKFTGKNSQRDELEERGD
jgi:hypothetical protein